MIPNDAVLEHLRATRGFQYEIGRVLGRGGMGTVYFPRERALDREVAIKVLALAEFDREIAKLAQDNDAVERKRLESRIAALSVSDGPEQEQMRELHVAQLALVQRTSRGAFGP